MGLYTIPDGGKKKFWHNELEQLEFRFNQIDPHLLSSKKEIDKWKYWENKIKRIKTSIAFFAPRDIESFENITNTLFELNKYLDEKVEANASPSVDKAPTPTLR